ncbi:SAM-dependent methyltransferase [Glycomyces harbinensis]|uniref:SAM-dependent methyltransferase, MidA family n=1 Tax=Glycomyces harbinensis TaxID=58114 RepID=A0A1G6VQF4_9ACTN|nr:SAM-dependent methyltransferase [Glycomyces harbinensis]SDD55066.1 SAM-dependent methyltransferase, MidA family [Glycomyces harbinensis]
MTGFEPWRPAVERALYGPGGFYRRELPSHHFTTSARAPAFADAVARLADEVDERLGRPEDFTIVDVGAGGGDLLAGLAGLLDERVRLVAVELRPRPRGLPERIAWRHDLPERVEGLLIACELLDNVPCDIAVVDDEGRLRYEEVDRRGRTRPGADVGDEDAKWLAEWWPIRHPGERAEIGAPRDAVWRDLAGRVARGTVLAVDYGHLREARPAGGTMTAFRDGREVPAVPDGSCDLTANVAVDAVGADHLELQGEALRALGASAERPPLALAYRAPTEYAMALARASATARLLDPAGLGAHWWMRTDR